MPSVVESHLLSRRIADMFKGISRAASYCRKSNNARHHFQGYPRSKGRCKWCDVPYIKE